MPRRLLPLLALALLVAQAPAVHAQDVVMRLGLDPATATVRPGEEANVTLTVENRGPFTLRVNLTHDATTLRVAYERVAFSVEPGTSRQVRVGVSAPGVTNGSGGVTFRASGATDGPVPAPPETASATFTLHVRPAAANRTNESPSTPPEPFDDRASNGTGEGGSGATGNQTTQGDQGGSGTGTSNGISNATKDGATKGVSNGTSDATANGTSGGTTNATANETTDATKPPADEPPRETPRAVLAPDWLDLRAAVRERVEFEFEVRNPGPRAQSYEAVLRLPLGWAGALQRTAFDVPAGGSYLLRGSVLPLPDAPDGEGSLAVSGPGGTAVALLGLRVDRPADAGPGSRSGPLPGEPDGAAAGFDAASAPPPAAQGILTLRVEPDEVRVPRGGRALAHLVVSNGLAIPLDARPLLAAPDGFRLDAAATGTRVEPGATLRIPLVFRADDALAEGLEADATARLDGHDAGASPFRLLVEPAETKPSSDAPPEQGELEDRADAPLVVALALAAAGGVALAAAWAWRRWHLAAFALYARLLPSRVLEHPKRRAIMDVVGAEPGVRLADLQRRLGLANGALRHHVDRLEAAGHLRSVPEGSHRRLYPPAAAGRVAPVPGLADRALRLIEERGPIAASDVAAGLGVSRQALHYHLKKLAAQGRIRAARQGGDLVLAAPGAATVPAAPAAAPKPAKAAPTAPRGGPSGPSP